MQFRVTGMTCAACSSAVERVTRKMAGVEESNVNLTTGILLITYDENMLTPADIIAKVDRAGFGAVITSDCHNRNYIDCFYPEAEEMLRTAGFSSKWILTDHGFREVAL